MTAALTRVLGSDGALPSSALHDERPVLRAGVHAAGVRLLRRKLSLTMPQIDEHVIGVHLTTCGSQQPMELRHPTTRGVVDRYESAPGGLTILPGGHETQWRYEGSAEVAFFFVAPFVLVDVAGRSLDIATDTVRLPQRIGHSDPLVHAVAEAFIHEVRAQPPAGSLYLDELTNVLIVHVLHRYGGLAMPSAPRMSAHARGRMQAVVDYVNDRLCDDVSLDAVAAAVNVSPYHLSRTFTRTMGIPLHQYVIQRRVERARELLRDPELTVGTIAARTGFADHSHLGRHFKRQLGITPSEFRRDTRVLVDPRLRSL